MATAVLGVAEIVVGRPRGRAWIHRALSWEWHKLRFVFCRLVVLIKVCALLALVVYLEGGVLVDGWYVDAKAAN